MKRINTIALCGLGLCQVIWAARPFDTDDAGTVAPGTFEAELGSESWNDKGAFGLGLKHGLTERMDLGVSMGYSAWPEAERSFENAELSAKYSLVPELLSASFATPLGTSEYSLNGILSKGFGDLAVNLNLGGDFTGGERHAELSWGVNPNYAFGPLSLGAEVRGDQHAAQDWKFGGQLKPVEPFAIDLGIGSKIASDPDWRVTAGLWFAFPTLEKKGS